MNELPAEFDTLRDLLCDFARRRRIPVYDTVVAFGFEVLESPVNWDYHCTPVNGLTFGATGGDGIHLSLLTSGPGAGAVVLTVPPGDPDNIILGADFASFLRLGYFGCFGWLEVLAFDPVAGDTEYRDSVRVSSMTAQLRDALRSTFALQPLADVTRYLADLQRQYLPYLVLPEREEWDARHGV
jgi:hypothetical protein